MTFPSPLVKPPLKVGDPIVCYCEHTHPIELFIGDVPVLSCPEVPMQFPVIFYDGSIVEVRRVRD